jgi:hypothetical protein
MSEVLHADIFFFITGIAVIVFSALLCVAMFHAIKALKSLRRILDKVEEGAEVITEDVRQVRAYFTEDGFLHRLIGSLVGSSRGAGVRGQKHARQDKKRTELKIKDEA